jgi:hypothetical protein
LLFYALNSKTAIPGLFLHAASENTLCTGNRDLSEKKIPTKFLHTLKLQA